MVTKSKPLPEMLMCTQNTDRMCDEEALKPTLFKTCVVFIFEDHKFIRELDTALKLMDIQQN
jgi:hypothetical protein